MLNRRVFVKAVTAAASTMVMFKAKANTLASLKTPDLISERPFQADWNQQLFEQLQGDRVFLHDATGQRFEAQLEAVTDLGSRAKHEQFAVRFLTFESLPEGVYQLSHRSAGSCQLFLNAGDRCCTALFSLLR